MPSPSKPTNWTIGLLTDAHVRDDFGCGDGELDVYLESYASQDVRRNVARAYVATVGSSTTVLGFYTISNFSIEARIMPIDVAKKLPRYPVPAALIGRLAVDQKAQGQGLGEYLLMDSLDRLLQLSEKIGIHSIVVDAKHDNAVLFYEKYGFKRFPATPQRLFLQLATLKKLMRSR